MKKSDLLYSDFEKKIKSEFNGYHIDVRFYPSGGMIDAEGCEECGTDDSVFATTNWKLKRGESMERAVLDLKKKLGI